MRITFNAPFILTFTLIASIILGLSIALGFSFHFLILNGDFTSSTWQNYFGALLYPINHASIQHLVGNFGIILLLGPILERKFGSKRLLLMCITTTIIIAVVHILISDSKLIGASGLVFMFIVLASLIDSTGKDIPLTFLLVAILFLGQEIIGSFRDDSISQMAHVCGGIMGIVFRYTLK